MSSVRGALCGHPVYGKTSRCQGEEREEGALSLFKRYDECRAALLSACVHVCVCMSCEICSCVCTWGYNMV